MSDAQQTAIRVGDDITHSDALFGGITGMILGGLAGLVVGAIIVGGTIATGGALAFVIGAGLLGVAGGGTLGKILGRHSTPHPKGKVLTGSPNVFVGGKPSARADADVAHCEEHSDSDSARDQPSVQGQKIMQGSGTVFINALFAVRKGDKGHCDFRLGEGFPTVFIGGPTQTVKVKDPKTGKDMEIESETSSIDGLIWGAGIVGGALVMLPVGMAIVAEGTAAEIGMGAIAKQLAVRLGGQVLLGLGLGTAGGAGLKYIGSKEYEVGGVKFGGQGSETQDLLEYAGQTLTPFVGAVKLPGVGESAYGLIDGIPARFSRSFGGGKTPPVVSERPGSGETPGDGDAAGTGDKPAADASPVAEPAGPLPAGRPQFPDPVPAPEAAAPEVAAPKAGEAASVTEPLPKLEPELPEPEPAPETPPPATPKPPVRVSAPGNRAADYNTYKSNADVPAHYSSDPRFQKLATDPAHQGKPSDSKMRQEAMAGLEAEGQGHVPGPIERGPGEIEFYDGNGNPWDVKTPPSPKPGQTWPFKPADVSNAIQEELGLKSVPGDPPGTFPNKITGLPVPRQIILDSSYMNPADHAALWNELNSNLTPDQLGRIVEINTRP